MFPVVPGDKTPKFDTRINNESGWKVGRELGLGLAVFRLKVGEEFSGPSVCDPI